MKNKFLLIFNKFIWFSDLIYKKINNFFYFLFKNLVANFSNFLIGIVFLIILVFYQAIVEILNFEIMGKEFTFGDSLNNLFSLGFEATWNLLISAVRSFSPSGFLGLAFEIITETLAFILWIIGYVVVLLVLLLKFSWYLMTQFGLYNILVILSWSYLIGMYRYVYNLITSFMQAKKSQQQLLNMDGNSTSNIDETENTDK